jgi:hypothetical protein
MLTINTALFFPVSISNKTWQNMIDLARMLTSSTLPFFFQFPYQTRLGKT